MQQFVCIVAWAASIYCFKRDVTIATLFAAGRGEQEDLWEQLS
jgi:hypothetical protein